MTSQWSAFVIDIYLLRSACVRHLVRRIFIAKSLVEGLLFGGGSGCFSFLPA